MKHLVLYGDSLLARMGRTEVLALETALGNEYLITNSATSGFEAGESLVRAKLVAAMPFDYIVISLGTNDAAPWRNVALDTYVSNVRKLVEAFGHNRVIFFLPPPVIESRQTVPKIRPNELISRYASAAKSVVTESGAKVIDPSIFQERMDAGVDYHVADGVHLNDEAYKILGDELKSLLG